MFLFPKNKLTFEFVCSNSFLGNILLFIVFFSYTIDGNNKNTVKIIVSGETHAMLYPCDCSENPVGGLAKRAHVIKSQRQEKNILLLDAGGFSGGGIYDFYTEGRIKDSIRTIVTMRSMAGMKYDAVAVGDEELQYGAEWLALQAKKIELPLVSANCRYKSGRYVVDPFKIVRKGNLSFGITALTPQEKLFFIDTAVVIDDPVESVKLIWKKMKRLSDYQVILSHLGEEYIDKLIKEFPQCDFFINGHRKMGIQPVNIYGKQVIMQFGFQGKNLSSLLFNPKSNSLFSNYNFWIDINDSIPDDKKTALLLENNNLNSLSEKSSVLDLYIMAQCPYGIPILKDLIHLSDNFWFIDLSIWFIGDVNPDGTLHSLNGSDEIFEEKMWLAIQHVYPDMWPHFLYLLVLHGADINQAINELGLDTARLHLWIHEKGNDKLAFHYRRSQRLNVNASPTIFLNNQMLSTDISYLKFANKFCIDIKNMKKPLVCDSVPECFEDIDCVKKGMHGICRSSSGNETDNRCIFNKAVEFDFLVILPDTMFIHPEYYAINTTKDLFPGVNIRTILMSDSYGKKIIAGINPVSLPLYLFEKKVEQTTNYFKIKSGIQNTGQWYMFNDDVMKKHYFYKRKELKNSLILFIDPLFPDIKNVFSLIFQFDPQLDFIEIRPNVYGKIKMENIMEGKEKRDKEAMRWIIFKKYYNPDIFRHYLRSYSTKPEDSIWQKVIMESGKDTAEFKEKTLQNGKLLNEIISDISDLEITEPVELLINNRELIPVKNRKHLKNLLGQLKTYFHES